MITNRNSELKILIVDDDLDLLQFTERLLKGQNYNVRTAASGQDCIKAIQLDKPDLILLDIIMPDISGVDVCRKIKNDPQLSSIYILLLSGLKTQSENISEGLDAGADGYLIKPIKNRELLAWVEAAFRTIRAETSLRDINWRMNRIFEGTGIGTWEWNVQTGEAVFNERWAEIIGYELDEKNRYQANVLEHVSDAIIATDLQYNIQYWNKTAEKQYGWTASEVIGHPLEKFIINDYLGGTIDIILQKIQKNGFWKGEVTQNRRDGTRIPIMSSLSVITDKANQPSGYISVNRDITDRKETETSLRLYGEILENMAEAIFLIRTADGVIVYTNSKAEEMFGYDLRELVGKHISIINAPSEISSEETARKIIQNLNANGVWEGDIQNIKKDGTLFWSNARISTFEHRQQGKVWISIHQDITQRKMAEQAMITSEEKYRTTLNASPDGILLINPNGIITEISEIGIQLFGADIIDDLVGKDFSEFVPSDEKDKVKEIIEKTTNDGFVQNIGLKIIKKNQSFFTAEISATLIQGPDGEPVSFMIIVRDISQRKNTETKQIHADRMANIGEMASGMAHEINQPLNIISMVMDKLLFEASRSETIDYAFLNNKSTKIFENIIRIRNIIDNLRDFSRSDEDYILISFDINLCIENAVSMITEQFKHFGINLKLNLEKQIPPIIGNAFRFEQVILNLLVNAKDAVIEKRSKQKEHSDMNIGIKSFHDDQSLIVEVTDNGIGISNEDIHNIMLPFYTTKDEGKGTGLGLSICYQIIKEMNGTIEISSDSSFGTTVKLVIPDQKKINSSTPQIPIH